MSNLKKMEDFVELAKELKNADGEVKAIQKEIEDNLFNKNDSTYINFIITKKETVNVADIIDEFPKEVQSNILTGDPTLEKTHVKYTESFPITEELAMEMQTVLLNYFKEKRQKIANKMKEVEYGDD